MKPSDVYVGVIDLFAVLLPGAILTVFLMAAGVPAILVGEGVLPASAADEWVTFLFAAYALGHFIFLIAASLDRFYDAYRRRRWPDAEGNAYQTATKLRRSTLGDVEGGESMNTFSWAKALLLIEKPQAAASVHRFEADSKFFRSLVVVLVVVSIGLSATRSPMVGLICLALAVPAFLRYAERRYKSTLWAYRFVIALAASRGEPEAREREG